MALTVAEWKKAILASLEFLSDRSYQERSWFGWSIEISSPDEMFCALFDDLSFEDFLSSPDVKLSERQRHLAEILRAKMNRYGSEPEPILDPYKVIDDPRWYEIRRVADELVGALRQRYVWGSWMRGEK